MLFPFPTQTNIETGNLDSLKRSDIRKKSYKGCKAMKVVCQHILSDAGRGT